MDEQRKFIQPQDEVYFINYLDREVLSGAGPPGVQYQRVFGFIKKL
jgi:hypothetical protein